MDDLFVDAYSITTGLKQRIPRHWLGDPVLGRDFRKTPAQREYDGDLPRRPTADSTVKEIDAWATDADIDLAGVTTKDDKLVAIEAALASTPVQVGVVEVEAPPPAADPLAPEVAARVGDVPAFFTTPTDAADTPSPDETPAAGDKE